MTCLHIELLSDACFAGSRTTLVADVEVCQELDELGLPQIGGRALRGLLTEEVAVILRTLGQLETGPFHVAAARLLGRPGSDQGLLSVGSARYAEGARDALRKAVVREPELRLLAARTTTVIRGQTRIDPDNGVAQDKSLRHTRMARQGLRLEAPLTYDGGPFRAASDLERAILAGAVELLRHGGLHRSRGFGSLRCELRDAGVPVQQEWMRPLLDALGGG